jgi:tetratricopeptide (TPR) repeat protein
MSLFRRSSAILLLLTVFSASIPSVPVFARSKKESDKCRRERTEGTVALNLGHYDDAARHFENAYAMSQDPLFLFYLGQAYRLGEKPEKALAAYNSFLRSASPNNINREQFERAAADIELIATILVKRGAPVQNQADVLEKASPPATAASKELEPPSVADEPAESAEKTEVPAAEPPVLATSASAAPSLASEKAARDATLVQAQPVQPPPDETRRRFYNKWWFWSSVVGVLALGGATAWWFARPISAAPATTYGAQRVLP